MRVLWDVADEHVTFTVDQVMETDGYTVDGPAKRVTVSYQAAERAYQAGKSARRIVDAALGVVESKWPDHL